MSKAQPDIDKQRNDATGFRFAIVVSRWNSDFTDKLLLASIEALESCGATKDFTRTCAGVYGFQANWEDA